ncbi:uncharacterized protein CCOS01_15329 [Colletotrichum costaricense]|uniref:Uncharacterized protein n=1 Tax=Colletotrichum costaricense TaxID=1209916 RepID=A0AAI9YHY5_9PEZI|nr:uncharacterized protein CCOS01_15329 [Colletotrichum costaricense]KAK1510498.1 hypothetical protein CCOS01_15329 [Colletotrichum costaricense]
MGSNSDRRFSGSWNLKTRFGAQSNENALSRMKPKIAKGPGNPPPPAEPVFGRLQVTADADAISQVTNKRPDQAVVDFIVDDAFAS